MARRKNQEQDAPQQVEQQDPEQVTETSPEQESTPEPVAVTAPAPAEWMESETDAEGWDTTYLGFTANVSRREGRSGWVITIRTTSERSETPELVTVAYSPFGTTAQTKAEAMIRKEAKSWKGEGVAA